LTTGSNDVSAFAQVRFAGLRFTPLSVAETVAALMARPPTAPFTAFVTPNAEHAFLRRRDALFRQCGDTCWISTNDSRILGRAALLAGLDLKFAPGAYVVDQLFRNGISPNDPISIIGCTSEIVADLVAQFSLTNVVQHIPPMGFIDIPEAVDAAVAFVVSHPARFVFVAMGSAPIGKVLSACGRRRARPWYWPVHWLVHQRCDRKAGRCARLDGAGRAGLALSSGA
jgi:N-acetylglucosaminyldiphosphoundecaprenol N-acetyl-beta-D-mannosaminyltransferase